MNVEHEAIEIGMLGIGEKRLGGGISYRLKLGGPQQAAQRAANALVVINDRDI